MLLAGDVEWDDELRLDVRDVDLLLVPHHGSQTSSSRRFLELARPRFAVVSAGFMNRYGHPAPAVVERYRDVGAHVVTTQVNGALRWRSRDAERIDAARCAPSGVRWWDRLETADPLPC